MEAFIFWAKLCLRGPYFSSARTLDDCKKKAFFPIRRRIKKTKKSLLMRAVPKLYTHVFYSTSSTGADAASLCFTLAKEGIENMPPYVRVSHQQNIWGVMCPVDVTRAVMRAVTSSRCS